MRFSRLLLGLSLGVVTPLLAGCSPTLDGIAGITVDETRNPVGVVASCNTPLSGANLYRLGSTTTGPYTDRLLIAGWLITADTTSSTVTWPMTGEATTSATIDEPLLEWPATGELIFGGWGDNHNVSTTTDVTFTARDLDRIRPGSVLTGTPNHLVTLGEFHDLACTPTKKLAPTLSP